MLATIERMFLWRLCKLHRISIKPSAALVMLSDKAEG